jgi:hypothetical protein
MVSITSAGDVPLRRNGKAETQKLENKKLETQKLETQKLETNRVGLPRPDGRRAPMVLVSGRLHRRKWLWFWFSDGERFVDTMIELWFWGFRDGIRPH